MSIPCQTVWELRRPESQILKSEGPGGWIMESNVCPMAGCVHATENHARAQGTQQSTKMLPHALNHRTELLQSSSAEWDGWDCNSIVHARFRNNSCFLHRMKVGCSWLALVLMMPHFPRLSRKKCCLWHLQSHLPVPWPGAWQRPRLVIHTAPWWRQQQPGPFTKHFLGALKMFLPSLVRDIPSEEGTIITPVFTAEKTKAQRC